MQQMRDDGWSTDASLFTRESGKRDNTWPKWLKIGLAIVVVTLSVTAMMVVEGIVHVPPEVVWGVLLVVVLGTLVFTWLSVNAAGLGRKGA
jgi:hypothetical protein